MTTPSPSPLSPREIRDQQLAVRAQLIARLQAMPQVMRDLPQWLLWKFLPREGGGKPPKVPYYAGGSPRGWPKGKPRDGKATDDQPQVPQGHELDRAALVTLDVAIQRLRGNMAWHGVGFAFLPGDGLIGIDIDHAIDGETGEISELCKTLVGLCNSYTEASVSGTGVHIICRGEVEKTFKDDPIGLEVYAGHQYFVCSGDHWEGTPFEAEQLDPAVLDYMRELVEDSKRRQADEKAAAAQARAQDRPAPSQRPAAPSGGDDFKRVNDAAMRSLNGWVTSLFPEAKVHGGGYRVTSKMLGRDLQEDLSIHPEGISDFGTERGRKYGTPGLTPIDVVLEWGARVGVSSPKDALHWLAQRLGITLPPRPTRLHVVRREGASLDERPEPPPEGTETPPPKRRRRAQPEGEGDGQPDPAEAQDGADAASSGRAGRKRPPEFWHRVNALCERFALVYGSDTAWDTLEMLPLKVSAMRLAFGSDEVKYWLASEARRMVLPTDLVFEPGQEVAPPRINMWGGLEMEATPCDPADVKPMLDLLRHLCSESAPTGDEVDAVIHWVLCWQSLPLQKLGTKMQTACVFHGAQGTGKNLYWDVWRDMFGVYGITVGQTELEDKFNGWVSRKLAIIGDEVVSRQEMYHNKNRLKLVVTQEKKFPIRGMQMETRWESNHANVVFLSNESQPLALEERDRRYMVIYTPLEADVELYQRVRDFLAAGGAAKWLHYLQTYPVEDFNAHTKPLMTRAKEDLIEAGWRPAVRFGAEWLGGYLDLPLRVCSSEQLYRAFRRWCDLNGERWPPAQAGFTGELKRWAKERSKRDAAGKLEAPRLTHKEVTPKEAGTRLKTIRCWFPAGTGPLPGVNEGEWAWESVKEFEREVRKFCRRPGMPDHEEDAP